MVSVSQMRVLCQVASPLQTIPWARPMLSMIAARTTGVLTLF
jgi:hypothetical protein